MSRICDKTCQSDVKFGHPLQLSGVRRSCPMCQSDVKFGHPPQYLRRTIHCSWLVPASCEPNGPTRFGGLSRDVSPLIADFTVSTCQAHGNIPFGAGLKTGSTTSWFSWCQSDSAGFWTAGNGLNPERVRAEPGLDGGLPSMMERSDGLGGNRPVPYPADAGIAGPLQPGCGLVAGQDLRRARDLRGRR